MNIPELSPFVPENIDEIEVVTTHFNPVRQPRMRDTFYEWFPTLGEIGPHLKTYEVVLDDDEPELERSIVLRGTRDTSMMWQKEAVLNVAFENAKRAGKKYFCWLDHDIYCENSRWFTSPALRLQSEYDAIQMFRSVSYLNQKGRPEKVVSGRVASGRGAPGGNWMAKMEVIENIGGFLPWFIVGGGDRWFAQLALYAFPGRRNRPYDPEKIRPFPLRDITYHYMRSAKARPFKSHYFDAKAFHIWHGSLPSRQHRIRDDILKRHAYRPGEDVIIGENGLLEWSTEKVDLKREVREFFECRMRGEQ